MNRLQNVEKFPNYKKENYMRDNQHFKNNNYIILAILYVMEEG